MKIIPILLTGVALFIMSGCNNPHIGLAQQESVDATELKSFCDSKKFVTSETKKADSLVAIGITALDGGKITDGYIAFGEATSLYKIAISHYNGKKADSKIGKLSVDLNSDKESLDEYKKLLVTVKQEQKAKAKAAEAKVKESEVLLENNSDKEEVNNVK